MVKDTLQNMTEFEKKKLLQLVSDDLRELEEYCPKYIASLFAEDRRDIMEEKKALKSLRRKIKAW